MYILMRTDRLDLKGKTRIWVTCLYCLLHYTLQELHYTFILWEKN